MSLNSLVRSRGYKHFMAKVYGWGAALVIIGALFKIQHYPGAGGMLMIGLGTEALIFFFSAFEPPHVEPDWSLVYPELAGMYHDGSNDKSNEMMKDGKTPIEQLDTLLEDAKIGPALIESLGQGLRKLTDTTSKLSDVSNASVATNEYVKNITSASKSAGDLSESYKKTSETLGKDIAASGELATNISSASKSASELAKTYINASEVLKKDINTNELYVNSLKNATASVNTLTENYTKSAEILTKNAKALDLTSIDSHSYIEKLHSISKNLAALNSVYELQLKSSNDQLQTNSKLQEQMNKFIGNLHDSVEFTSKYKEQAAQLNQNISALNNVYGNMLAAMNVNTKK
jgi:gliding motility-associated protein GldL